jgi:hypothetical protein
VIERKDPSDLPTFTAGDSGAVFFMLLFVGFGDARLGDARDTGGDGSGEGPECFPSPELSLRAAFFAGCGLAVATAGRGATTASSDRLRFSPARGGSSPRRS